MSNFLEKIKQFWQGILIVIIGGGVAIASVSLGADALQTPLQQIHALEQAYILKHGRPLQILSGNRLPHYETGTVKEKFGKNIGAAYSVDIYKEPDSRGGEWGYTAEWEDEDGAYANGVGSLKAYRDFTILKTTNAASSTSSMFFDFFSWIPIAYAAITQTHTTDLTAASSQYWSITDASQTGLDITGDLTFAGWINKDTDVTVTLGGKFSSSGGKKGYRITHFGGALDFWRFDIDTAADGATGEFSQEITDDTWHHIAVVYDASASDTLWYLDGAFQETDDHSVTAISDNTGEFQIGSNPSDGNDTHWDGLIDDVRIWSRTLSSAEITSLHGDPCNFNNGSSLQGQWILNNDGLDETANDNDLTNNNTATFQTTDLPYTCAVTGFNNINIIQ